MANPCARHWTVDRAEFLARWTGPLLVVSPAAREHRLASLRTHIPQLSAMAFTACTDQDVFGLGSAAGWKGARRPHDRRRAMSRCFRLLLIEHARADRFPAPGLVARRTTLIAYTTPQSACRFSAGFCINSSSAPERRRADVDRLISACAAAPNEAVRRASVQDGLRAAGRHGGSSSSVSRFCGR